MISGVSSQSVNNVFSATYTNYRIIVNLLASSANAANLRLRVSGVDASGSNYKQQFNRLDSVGTNNGTVSTTNLVTLAGDVAAQQVSILDVFNPFVTASTQFLLLTGVNNASRFGLVEHQLSTSFDGFSLITAGGTFTGSISTFGYNA